MTKCSVCGKGFDSERDYERHIEQAHEAMYNTYESAFCKATERDPSKCQLCDNTYESHFDSDGKVTSHIFKPKREDDDYSNETRATEGAKDWWESKSELEQEQILLASGVDPRHKGLSWNNLGQENRDSIKQEYYEAREAYDEAGNYSEKCKVCGKVFDNPADAGSHPHAEEGGADDPLRKVADLAESWNTLDKERKAQLFESLGINQGSAYSLANLDWYNLSPQLQTDASEAYIEEAKIGDFDDDRINISYMDKDGNYKSVKDAKDIDKEKEVNEAYRDIYDVEKHHLSPNYKKKALEYSVPEECPFCQAEIKEPETLDWHMEKEHGAHIPSQYTQTGIQGSMAGTDFDSLDTDFYSEAFDSDWACPRCGNKNVTIKKDENGNPIGRSCPKCGLGGESNPNHDSGSGEFTSGGSSGLNDSQKRALDKYIEKHGKEDQDSGIINPMQWDEDVHLPANVLKQVKGANHDEMLDYITGKLGEAKVNEVEGKCPHCGSSDISSDKYEYMKCNNCNKGFDIPDENEEANEGQGGTWGRSDYMLNPEHTDETQCIVCGRSVSDHSNPNTDYRGMRGDAPSTDHYFLGGDLGGSDDKYDFESLANEAKWQCDNCGQQFEDAKGAGDHEKETGHHDMGFATTLSGDSKWDKLSKSSAESHRSDLEKQIRKKKEFINVASQENPLHMAEFQIELERLEQDLASLVEAGVEAKSEMELTHNDWGETMPFWCLTCGAGGEEVDDIDAHYNLTGHGKSANEGELEDDPFVQMMMGIRDKAKKDKKFAEDIGAVFVDESKTNAEETHPAIIRRLIDDYQRQFGEDQPQDADGTLEYLMRNGVPRDEAVAELKSQGAYFTEGHWKNAKWYEKDDPNEVTGSPEDDPKEFEKLDKEKQDQFMKDMFGEGFWDDEKNFELDVDKYLETGDIEKKSDESSFHHEQCKKCEKVIPVNPFDPQANMKKHMKEEHGEE